MKRKFDFCIPSPSVSRRCVPFSPTRKKTLRPINQRGNKVQTFFLARTTFHLRRPATVSPRSLNETARRCAPYRPRKPNQPDHGPANPYNPVIPHSYTYATPAIEASGKVAATSVGAPNTVPWHAEHGISVLEMSLL